MRQVRASLDGFYWERPTNLTGDVGLEVAPGFWLRWGEQTVSDYERELIDSMMSPDLADDMRWATWLCFDLDDEEPLEAGAMAIAFQVALWLVKPTKSKSTFRFEREVGPGNPTDRPPNFHLNSTEFLEIRRHSPRTVLTEDLLEAGRLVPSLLNIARRGGRLNTSLLLTYQACVTIHWMPAFVNHCAAAEAMLTYYPKHSTTRMAKTFAALTERNTASRDLAFAEFKRLYAIRSGITHGRGYTFSSGAENLANLAAMGAALRRAWRAVLSRPVLQEELEHGDAARGLAYGAIEQGYAPSDPAGA